MQGEAPKAIGLIRRDMHGNGVDIHQVAQRYGYRLVWTVRLDTGPLASVLILAGTIYEHGAAAVIVPSFEHADAVRHAITDIAALATPMQVYPRGYRWPLVDMGRQR
ncbi:hypothetical protein [Nocardia jinanensis]|uniref:Uncharacterized protein n=1 Tax=Nocardia jinanensis TaxID=382504 RepID=A0A917RXB5_9NOCA|nr:hypothetical protein [Nocardia jinanensis]GGL42223.1 hypothetical protein GCM10011588_66230 [Nocardia jinanensis]